MVETVPPASVLSVTAEPPRKLSISPVGAPNTHGIKPAANVLLLTNQEEMLMLKTTTLMDLMMLVFGRSIM